MKVTYINPPSQLAEYLERHYWKYVAVWLLQTQISAIHRLQEPECQFKFNDTTNQEDIDYVLNSIGGLLKCTFTQALNGNQKVVTVIFPTA